MHRRTILKEVREVCKGIWQFFHLMSHCFYVNAGRKQFFKKEERSGNVGSAQCTDYVRRPRTALLQFFEILLGKTDDTQIVLESGP